MRWILAAGSLAALAAPAVGAPAPERLAALPASVTLTGPGATQQLVIEAARDGRMTGDRTARARFRSSNPAVAAVEPGGMVRALGDGAAVVVAAVEGREVRVPVRVSAARRPAVVRFSNHVLPVLTKSGCNSGACHGASAGKGGLKLTLRGYDPAADHATLTRQAWGRRVVPQAPEQSLLLQKPTMGVPHAGGMRFKPASAEYRLIARWIAAGSAPPAPADPSLTRLEVFPPAALLRPGDAQQVLVRGVFSDGHTEDVTRWVKFGSSDDAVATVDDAGRVKVRGSGEAAVTLWYLSKVAFTRITVPFPRTPPASVFDTAERRNLIDGLVLDKLRALGIPPAPLVGDAQFIRRAFLDAAGILPTPAEVDEFLADRTPDRRARLVDRLLQRPEFVDYWAYRWSDLLLVSSRRLPSRGMWSFSNWIRNSVAANKPWDRFAREIVTARGSTLLNGAANYFVLHKDPIDLSETTSQAFLGMSLTCSRCHNHPLEKWTLNDYYGMANLFARVRLKNGESAGETIVYATDSGDVAHIRTGLPVPPRPLDGRPLPLEATTDRREHLAAWLTSPENPYFARAAVNRVWRNFFGRGLVEAEDDLRLTNPPSNEELLAAVTADFVRHGFDLRHLMRTLMNSAAYQRASTPARGAVAEQRFYSTYIPRRLPAEVVLDTLSQVTGVPTEFPRFPRGTRAMQLPDTEIASYFLTAFGRPQRAQTCSCERQEETNVAQALHLSNGDTLNDKLRAKESVAGTLADLPDEQLIDTLYLRAYSRRPEAAERRRVLDVLRRFTGGTRREAVEDLLSALLTTKEFLFNH